MDANDPAPELTVILPVYNEQECIATVIRELLAALDRIGRPFEVIAVNDGSTDNTRALLRQLAGECRALRVMTLVPNAGQSAALATGFRAARGSILVTMDADGQNDPADIAALLAGLQQADVCCGYRVDRHDSASKKIGSRLANAVRQRVLHDGIRDTGCTLKAFRAWTMRDLPPWKGMHRFLPALALLQGAAIVQVPVHHRPRAAGTSKYTNWGRLKQTLWDLWAVRWMQARTMRFRVEPD